MLLGNYPDWDIWIVPCFIGPTGWSAKPKGTATATVNAGSPEELIELLSARG